MAADPIPSGPTLTGDDVSLRASGWGRFPAAAFLGFWLCFWVAGETFVVGLLGWGLWHLVSGRPYADGRAPMEAGPALGVAAFLLVWLTFWTIGGVSAMRELARLLWGHDRLRADADGLAVTHSAGPFRGHERIVRERLRAIALRGRASESLVALTDARTIELSRLGTRAEREAAAALLTRALALDPSHASAAGAHLPDGWEETATPEGAPALMPDRARRATQARVVGALALLLAAAALFSIEGALRRPALGALAAMITAAAAGTVWGAVSLARGRDEWRLGTGRLVLQRRFGDGVKELFTAVRLELGTSRDSDGDVTYELVAVAEEPVAPAGDRVVPVLDPKRRRRILGSLHDEVPPRRLGEWLARRTGVPFEDHTTPDAQRADLARLREQLRASGALGRFVDRLLEGVDRGKRPGA